MRIIRGKYRGHILHPPRNMKARPTTDMAREAIFNILENNFNLAEVRVLDLFAGTGSISYEFASRGTPAIDLVEQNPVQFRFILKTIHELHLDEIHAWKRNVFSFLKQCTGRYDIIFADPPFKLSGINELPGTILRSGLLTSGGWFILEHPEKLSFTHITGFLMEKKYGPLRFTVFREPENNETGKKDK